MLDRLLPIPEVFSVEGSIVEGISGAGVGLVLVRLNQALEVGGRGGIVRYGLIGAPEGL